MLEAGENYIMRIFITFTVHILGDNKQRKMRWAEHVVCMEEVEVHIT
jgi:hypothetical protein